MFSTIQLLYVLKICCILTLSFQVQFSCIIPNIQFYMYLVIIVASLDVIYILASAYSLLWQSIPKLRKLSRLLGRYRDGVENYSAKYNWDKSRRDDALDVLGGLKSQDVELLLDLLAETSGVEVAIRILTLLDAHFYDAWKVNAIKQLVSK